VFGRHRRSADDELPFWRQRGWRLSAGFFVGVVCMAAAAWLATDERPTAGKGSVADQGPLSAAAPRGGDGRPVDCRTDDRDTAMPETAPDDVTWRPFPYGKVPVSLQAGPLHSDGALLWCFAHTPMGAVMAAHVIPTQTSSGDWRLVTDQQVVEGPSRDFFVAARTNLQDTEDSRAAVGSFVGFAVASYSNESATVRLLVSSAANGSKKTYFTTTIAVKWVGGDWKVEARRDGALYAPVSIVTGNAGFIMWKV
jgi:hypothetical protein